MRRGRGGMGRHGPPIVETRRKIANVVGNSRKIVKVVRNCQSCRRGGGGVKILNVVVRKNIWFVGKVLPLPPTPPPAHPQKTTKKTWVPRRH